MVGQMIRLAIGNYLACECNRCDYDCEWTCFRLGASPNESGGIVVRLLMPISRLAELEVLAIQRETTPAALVRYVVCGSLLLSSPIQPPMAGWIPGR